MNVDFEKRLMKERDRLREEKAKLRDELCDLSMQLVQSARTQCDLLKRAQELEVLVEEWKHEARVIRMEIGQREDVALKLARALYDLSPEHPLLLTIASGNPWAREK